MVADNVPQNTMRTQCVTQVMMDECRRALGRDLWDYEVVILDNMMVELQRQNRLMARAGKYAELHSTDELVHLFIDRLQSKEAQELARKITEEAKRKHDTMGQIQDMVDSPE